MLQAAQNIKTTCATASETNKGGKTFLRLKEKKMHIAGTPLPNYITDGSALNTKVISSSWSWTWSWSTPLLKEKAGWSGGGGGGGQAVHMRLCLDMDQGFETKQ